MEFLKMENEIQFIINNVKENKENPQLHRKSKLEYGFVYRFTYAEQHVKDICEDYINKPFARDENLFKLSIYTKILIESKDRHYSIYEDYKANKYNTIEFYNKIKQFYEYMNKETDDFKLIFKNENEFIETYLKDLEILLFLEPDIQKVRDIMEFLEIISEAVDNEYT